jgi:hypothetical protein
MFAANVLNWKLVDQEKRCNWYQAGRQTEQARALANIRNDEWHHFHRQSSTNL